jgi:type I restriction enzyme S subunit
MVNGQLKAGEEVLAVSESSAGYQLAYVHSLAVPPGCKQTEVGVIPEDWNVCKINELGEVKRGAGSQYIKYAGESIGVRLIRINDFFEDNPVFVQPAKEVMRFCIDKEDILFAGTGNSAGASYIPKDEWIGLPHSYNAPRIRVNNKGYKPYLLYCLQSDYLFKQQKALFVGAAQPFLDTKAIRSFDIALPSTINEQRAIATALSDVDALLIKLDQLIAKKRDLKQATMQQLLTGRTRLPGFSGKWDKAQLKSFIRSHNSGIYKKSEKYGQGCNIIGVSDLYGINCVDGQSFSHVPLTASERAKHTLETGDLLYGESSLVREGIARTVYVTEKGAGTAFAWHTRRYNIDQSSLLSPFLYYYLQGQRARKHMMDQSIQTAITGINTTAYFECPILVPSLAEQTAIATILSDMDAEIAALEARRDKTRALKQGMMQELLTGRIRLV